MIVLRDKETGEEIGRITEEQLQFLMDQLEEESADDADYYITEDELAVFEEGGADPELVSVLRKGLQGRDGYDVTWEAVDDVGSVG